MSQEPLSLTCPKCGARFFNGRLYWATGKPGRPEDLASLVCQPYGDSTCINFKKEQAGGDTWQKRLDFLNAMASELDLPRID